MVLSPPPGRDPFALDLWGSTRRDLLTALVATAVTAVTARLPHSSTRGTADDPGARRRAEPAVSPQPAPDHHDILLRRLRELGELHRAGVLRDEESATTRAAVLRDF